MQNGSIFSKGRELTPRGRTWVYDVITANSSIQIVCIMENGTALKKRWKRVSRPGKWRAANSYPYGGGNGKDFYSEIQFRTVLESYSSITLIGDVNPSQNHFRETSLSLVPWRAMQYAVPMWRQRLLLDIFALEMAHPAAEIGEYIAKSRIRKKEEEVCGNGKYRCQCLFSKLPPPSKEGTICIDLPSGEMFSTICFKPQDEFMIFRRKQEMSEVLLSTSERAV